MSENQVQNTVAARIIGEQSTWKFEKTSNKTFLKKKNQGITEKISENYIAALPGEIPDFMS